ncbi:MAG: hypothetical protein ACJAUR_000432 [Ulvibacter sp.]
MELLSLALALYQTEQKAPEKLIFLIVLSLELNVSSSPVLIGQ